MSGKLPAIQLYPGDWLRDAVSGCSLAAQGLWLRMMYMMHDSERYGYLVMNGVPIPPEFIARKCGADSLEQYTTLLAELDRAGVPSRTKDEIIFSRRMVRDQKKRDDDADRQRNYRNGKGSRPKDVTHDVTDMSQRSSSSISSSASTPSRVRGKLESRKSETAKIALEKARKELAGKAVKS